MGDSGLSGGAEGLEMLEGLDGLDGQDGLGEQTGPGGDLLATPPKDAPSDSPSDTTPIKDLSFYSERLFSGKVIRVDGGADVLSATLEDDSGKINVKGFGPIAHKFKSLFVLHQEVRISGGDGKPANVKYSPSGHQYDWQLNETTAVNVVKKPGFTPFALIKDAAKFSKLSAVGVVHQYGRTTRKRSRVGADVSHRSVLLASPPGDGLDLTLWGAEAERELEKGVVLSVELGTVSRYESVTSLSAGKEATVTRVVDGDDAATLLAWYRSEGSTLRISPF